MIIAVGFMAWVTYDSLKRGKLALGYAISCIFLLWWITLPFYFAGRKLRQGETREGGFAWNVCKYFLLLWTFFLGYCLIGGMINVSDHLSNRTGYMSSAAEAGAAAGVAVGLGAFFCLWFGIALPTLITGLLLKKNSVVETSGEPPAQQIQSVNQAQTNNPPPAPRQEVLISIARQGKTIGTFSEQKMIQQLASGEILPTDHYWKQGMAGWELVANYKG